MRSNREGVESAGRLSGSVPERETGSAPFRAAVGEIEDGERVRVRTPEGCRRIRTRNRGLARRNHDLACRNRGRHSFCAKPDNIQKHLRMHKLASDIRSKVVFACELFGMAEPEMRCPLFALSVAALSSEAGREIGPLEGPAIFGLGVGWAELKLGELQVQQCMAGTQAGRACFSRPRAAIAPSRRCCTRLPRIAIVDRTWPP